MSKSKTSESTEAAHEALNFEAALGELECLVEQLEQGELSLSDSLKQFERGVSLSRHCHSLLDDARQRVLLLTDPQDEQSASDFNRSDEKSD